MNVRPPETATGAVSTDSGFALAYRGLSWVSPFEGEVVESYESGLRAGALNVGLAARESLLVAADSLAIGLFRRNDSATVVLAGRVLTMLAEATRRYPNDPEAWTQLGVERYRFGGMLGISRLQALEALDKAIILDSAFVPPYPMAVELALTLNASDRAREYASRFLAFGTSGLLTDAIKVVNAILGGGSGDLQGDLSDMLRDAPSEVLFHAAIILGSWPDSAEAGVRVAEALAHDGPSAHPVAGRRRVRGAILAYRLAYRGHLHRAYEVSRRFSADVEYLVSFLANIGLLGPDSARGLYDTWMRGEGTKRPVWSSDPEQLVYAQQLLPSLASHGDTAAITRFIDTGDGRLATGVTPRERAEGEYWRAAGRAYLALAEGDSVLALTRFSTLAEQPCPWVCVYDRLTAARLLMASDRDTEAAIILDRPPSLWLASSPNPVEILWLFERARVHDRLGNREQALDAYQYVADAWRNADPELAPVVREAKAALGRMMKNHEH